MLVNKFFEKLDDESFICRNSSPDSEACGYRIEPTSIEKMLVHIYNEHEEKAEFFQQQERDKQWKEKVEDMLE